MRAVHYFIRHRNAILALVFSYAAFICVWQAGKHDKYSTAFALLAIGTVLFTVLAIVFAKKLFHANAPAVRRMLSKAASRFFGRLFGKITERFARKHGGTIIRGQASTSRLKSERRRGKKERHKKKRWRELQTPSERMGFIYAFVIEREIKSGASIRKCDTPSEIRQIRDFGPAEEKALDYYIDVRYDTHAIPDDALLLQIKEELGAG